MFILNETPKKVEELTQGQMIADIKATFPDLMARPIGLFSSRYAGHPGVWTGGCEAEMPDGYPIFSSLHSDSEKYDGYVHAGFIAWLKKRGWHYEHYDGGVFFLFPQSHWEL